MKTFLSAMRTYLASNSSINGAATGGVHAGRAPSDASAPYVVWSYRGKQNRSLDTGGRELDAMTVRFECYSDSAAEAAGTAEVIATELTGWSGDLSGCSLLVARALRDGLDLSRGLSGVGADGWRAFVDVEFLVQLG